MSDELLEEAIRLIKQGQVEGGGKILANLLNKNARLQRAWAWMYACVKTDEQRIQCLKKVLEINPNNAKAKVVLLELEDRQTSTLSVIDVIPTETKELNNELEPKAGQAELVTKVDPEEFAESTEHHVFNPKNYHTISIKPDDNPFSKKRVIFTGLPEIESGMYSNTLVIGGIALTPDDHPKCIEAGHKAGTSQCYICEFFSEVDCPIRRDPTILGEVRTLFSQNKRYWQEIRERQLAVIDAVYSELKMHGRPLHYEVLTSIMQDRHPKLRLSASNVLSLMKWHPEKFEKVEIGVYQAK